MTTALALLQAQGGLPAHLQGAFGDGSELSGGIAPSFAVVSLRGKMWHIKHRGEEYTLYLPADPNNGIPANTIGTINYFCQPHCLSNMKGTIVVTPIGDINNDGKVDGADIGLLIGAWGSSNPAADINHDGVVDGGDLGILLGNWTG